MRKKILYRTVIEVEILSEEPLNPEDCDNLKTIDYEITEGSWSGKTETKKINQKLKGIKAADATRRQGSSTDFFFMDKEGNDIEDPELLDLLKEDDSDQTR